MQKTITTLSPTEQELEIILSAEEFGPEYNKELDEAKRTVHIKGFRKGHAPMGLLKKLAGPSIEVAVAEKLAGKYFTEIITAENIKPANRAQIADFSFANDTLTLKLVYEIHPEFELKDFSEYTFTKANYVVGDKEVEREIELILKSHGTLVTAEEPAGEKDTVIGDAVRINDNGEVDEASKIASHHFNLEYLPAENPFRLALLGKKAGDVVEVINTPAKEDDEEESAEDAEELKPTRFQVIVTEVKRLELPELDDELVKEISQQRFENVADFKADVRLQLEQHFTMKSDNDLLEAISGKMVEENPIPVPNSMIESFQDMLLENAKRQLGQEFPKGFDVTGFRASMRDNAEKHARWMLITQKVAEMNKLTVTDEDIVAFAEKEVGKNEALDIKQVIETYKSPDFRDYIADSIMKEKVYNAITEKVTVTEEETPVPEHRM